MSKDIQIKIYTVPELWELLQLKPQRVRKYLREGKIKGRKAGTKWIVTDEALKEFLRGE